jgi:glutamate:GABA antiporter
VFTQTPANKLTWAQLTPGLTDLPGLNLWATIAFAFAGLELASTMGHEIQDPRRNLPRAIYIAAPLIALIYVCGTGSMLWLIPQNGINAVTGPLQGIAAGMSTAHTSWRWVVPACALLLTISRIGGLGAWLTGSARVAFVVGLDRYFPPAFGRVHPRWHTPYVAILSQAPIAAFFLLLSVLGKGTTVERAFLILIDMSLLISFIPYLYLFACFMVHCYKRRSDSGLTTPGGGVGAVVTGMCGLAVTLFAMVVALVPPPDTASVWLHELKLAGGSLFLVLIGFAIYGRAKRKQPS